MFHACAIEKREFDKRKTYFFSDMIFRMKILIIFIFIFIIFY